MQPSGYSKAAVVTPSDTVNITGMTPKALYVGGAGNVSVVINKATVVFTAPPIGSLLPIGLTRVNATGTTATLLVVLGD